MKLAGNAAGNERGAVLLFALGVMVALLLIAAASSLFTRGDSRLTANLRDATQALFVADAGIGWAHNRLRGADSTLYLDSNADLDGTPTTFGGGTFTVEIGTRDSDGRRVVNADGDFAGVRRSVRTTLRRLRLDPVTTGDCLRPGDADGDSVCDSKLGIVSHRTITVRAGSLIDSFNGDSVSYAAGSAEGRGNVATNGDLVLLGSGTVVRGGVNVGRTLSAGSNTLEQSKVALPALFIPPLPTHQTVCSGHTNPGLVDCDPPFGTITAVLAGSPPDQIMTIQGGQTICMPAGTYCFQKIEVQAGGRLRIVDTPASGTSTLPTVLHLGSAGGVSFRILGKIEYGTEMRPNLLKVFARGELEIAGWSDAGIWGLFYAPRSAARLNTNTNGYRADFFGAVYADQVTLGGGPVRFHVDEDARFGDFCGNASDPVCKPAVVVRDDWVELRG